MLAITTSQSAFAEGEERCPSWDPSPAAHCKTPTGTEGDNPIPGNARAATLVAEAEESVMSWQMPYEKNLACMAGFHRTSVGIASFTDMSQRVLSGSKDEFATLPQGLEHMLVPALMRAGWQVQARGESVLGVVQFEHAQATLGRLGDGIHRQARTANGTPIPGATLPTRFVPMGALRGTELLLDGAIVGADPHTHSGGLEVNILGVGGKIRAWEGTVSANLNMYDSMSGQAVGFSHTTSTIRGRELGAGYIGFDLGGLIRVNAGEVKQMGPVIAMKAAISYLVLDLTAQVAGAQALPCLPPAHPASKRVAEPIRSMASRETAVVKVESPPPAAASPAPPVQKKKRAPAPRPVVFRVTRCGSCKS